MKRISVNELESLVRKAAVGAGVDHGYAQEAAQSAVWLAAAGIDCLAGLARALESWSRGESGPVTADREHRTCTLQTASGMPAGALYAAPAIRDFAELMLKTRGFDRIEARNVELPYLTLGQLARRSGTIPLTVTCLDPGAATPRWTARISGNRSAGGVDVDGDVRHDGPGDIRVMRSNERDPCGTPLAVDVEALFAERLSIAPQHYDTLGRFFSFTLVPDSDESRRHGAGAGLVDSD